MVERGCEVPDIPIRARGLAPYIGRWCNGNIRDSKPFDVGSIPTRLATLNIMKKTKDRKYTIKKQQQYRRFLKEIDMAAKGTLTSEACELIYTQHKKFSKAVNACGILFSWHEPIVHIIMKINNKNTALLNMKNEYAFIREYCKYILTGKIQ